MLNRDSGRNGFAIRREERQSRRAVLVRAGAGFLFLTTLATLTWWVLSSGTFAVKRIDSGAYRYTEASELEAVFGHFIGHNIWTLKSDDIAEAVAALPWIRDVRVLRSLPNNIQLDFREWTPLLTVESVTLEGQVYDRLVMLEDGRLLSFPEHLLLPALPMLVGVQPVRQGDDSALQLPVEVAAQLLELIFSIEDAGLESAHPVDFIVARSEGFAIVLQDGQGSLLVGREDFGPRVQLFMSSRDHADPALVYDLRFENRLTVRKNY